MLIFRLLRALTPRRQAAACCRSRNWSNDLLPIVSCDDRHRAVRGRSKALVLATQWLLLTALTPLQAGVTINHVPPNQVTLPLGSIVFSADNGNLISVGYADMGAVISLELAGGSGAIVLESVAGLTKQYGNNGSGFMNYKGTVTAINAALSHLTYYQPGNGTSGFIILSTYDSTNTLDQDFIHILVNNAPVLAMGETLPSVDQGTVDPAGETIATLLGSEFTDANNNTLAGIVVVGNASDSGTQGSWEYSNDEGVTWFDVGSVSTATGLLLDAAVKLRFLPLGDFTGTPGALTVHAVDNSVATTFTSGSTRSVFDTTIDAASSQVAEAGVEVSTSISIIGANDAPLGRSKAVTTNESTAYTFSAADFGFSDVDAGDAMSAVRIDSLPLDGNLTLSGVAVTVAQAVATADIAYLVFTPAVHANGARYASFTFSVRDQSSVYDPVPNTLTVNVTAVPAVVTSVGVPAAGTYGAGASMDFIVNFSESITVDTDNGTPALMFWLEHYETAYAEYQSGSGTAALTFRYTVQNYHRDTDGIEVDSLEDYGRALVDVFGDHASLTLNDVGDTTAVLVDGNRPGVSSVDVPASGTYVVGGNLDFTVNFSENITVDVSGGTPRIALTLDAGVIIYADYLSGSGSSALIFRYTIADGNLDTNGLTVGGLGLNGGTLKDVSNNDATIILNNVGSTVAVLIDAVAPQVTSIVRHTPSAQDVQTGPVIFEVTFSESVTAVGTHSFAVIPVNGGTTTGSVVSVTGGPEVYEVTVNLTGGAGDFRLDVGVVVTTFATGFYNSGALAFDQAGNLYVADQYWVKRVTSDGVVSTFASGFTLPHGVVVSPAGDLYVADSTQVKKVTSGGVVTTFATGFSAAAGLAFDSTGNLYVGNYGNKTVSKVTPSAVVSTFATNIDAPFGLAFDAAGNLFVSSRDTNVISKISPGGVVTGFVTGLNQPYQLQFDAAGDLFVANRLANQILRVKPDGTVTTYAANLPESTGLAFDAAGALYVSSHYGDNTVRKVISSVSDLAGNAVGALTYSSGEIYTYDPNDAPTATNLTQSIGYTEDGGAVALADIVVSDADASDTITATLTLSSSAAGSLSVGIFGSSTSVYTAGTGVWTVTGSLTDVNAALAAVTFTPAANYNTSLTIATQIRDAGNTGPANGSITLTGTPVNDAPVITSLNGDVRAYSEGGSFVGIDTGAMAGVADAELDALDNYSGATITVVRNGGAHADDDFGFFAGSGVSLSGGNILKSGSSIATFVVTGGKLVITFVDVNGQTPTTFNANYIVRNVGYRNTSDNPPGSVTLNVTASDGELTSSVAAVTINITATNDAPTGISLSSSSVNQSQGANAVVGALSTMDVDDSAFSYALVSGTDSTHNALFNVSGASLRANDPAAMAPGSYAVRIRTTDSASATFEKSFSITVVDDVAPASPTTPDLAALSDTGSSSSDNITSDTTPTFTGTAEANSTIELFRAGAISLGAVQANSSGTWSITVGTALTAGTHSITATAADAANNTSAASPALSITIDDTGPSSPSKPDLADASDTGFSDTDDVTNATTPTFTGTAEANSTVELFRGGSISLGTASVDGSGDWAFTVGTALIAGDYSITAVAMDAAGTASAASSALVMTIDVTAPATPAVTAISDDAGSSATDFITNDTTLILSGTAEADSIVTVLRNTVEVGTVIADSDGAWSFDFTGTSLAEGSHTFTASATDLAGNTSGSSPDLLVEIVIETLSAPVIAAISNDTGASSTDGITNDATLVLTGTAPANQTVTVARNGVGEIGTTIANGAGAWTFDYSATTLPAGTYLFTAIASDTAGNVSSVSADFPVTIDTTAPAIATEPVGGTHVAGGSFDLSVTATDDSALTYQWYRGGSALTDGANRSGSTSATITHTAINAAGFAGDYTVVVTDLAGNTATSAVATIVIEQADQTITFPVIADRLTTNAPFAISATASTGLPVTFSVVSGPANVFGSTVTLTGAPGTVILRAEQSGNELYSAAVPVDRSFVVTAPSEETPPPASTHQYFFGPIGEDGRFALYIRSNGEAVLIVHLPAGEGSSVLQFKVNPDGSFRAGTPSVSPMTRTPGNRLKGMSVALATAWTISGSVVNGQLFAQVEPGAMFNGTAESPGSTAALAGFYEAPTINGAGTTYLIVGPNGTVLSATTIGNTTEVSPGVVSSSGEFSVRVNQSTVLAGSLRSDGTLSAQVTTNGMVTTNISGVSADVTHTDRLINISTRGATGDNDKLIIAGFVISGSSPKDILIRAVGPGLTGFGVTGAMPNPVLTLFRGNQIIDTNDDWSSSTHANFVASEATRLGASPLASASKDAALRVSLDPGIYTAHITRAPGTANGVALIELYDASLDAGAETQKLVNISSRGEVGTGENILISGFVVTGNYPKKMLIRGVGPSLARQGLAGVLADPILRIWKGNTEIASNDDWSADNALAIDAAAMQVGAFLLDNPSKDAAILLTLAPGVYTAQVSGSNGTTGIALVEVYDVP